MDLKKYYHSLPKDDQFSYASAIERSVEYLRIHLIPKKGTPDRTPPLSKLEDMAKHSNGNVSLGEVINHFKKAA